MACLAACACACAGACTPVVADAPPADPGQPAEVWRLEVRDGGATAPVLAALPVAEGTGWCLHWNHSVTGDPVVDCYTNDRGRMTLDHAIQPDFAAGLGHVPGRGRFGPGPNGGYLIAGIAEPVPGNAYVLRIGAPAVDHRLVSDGGAVLALSALAAGRRVTVRLARIGEDP